MPPKKETEELLGPHATPSLEGGDRGLPVPPPDSTSPRRAATGSVVHAPHHRRREERGGSIPRTTTRSGQGSGGSGGRTSGAGLPPGRGAWLPSGRGGCIGGARGFLQAAAGRSRPPPTGLGVRGTHGRAVRARAGLLRCCRCSSSSSPCAPSSFSPLIPSEEVLSAPAMAATYQTGPVAEPQFLNTEIITQRAANFVPDANRKDKCIGYLDVFVHQARDIHNVCIYHKQDVYAKLCLTSSPDVSCSTKVINSAGRNPVFEESLRLDVQTVDASLKCEIWMLSRVRNYLEDQLLGFALVPLADIVMRDGKLV